jgi:hypothetical protein
MADLSFVRVVRVVRGLMNLFHPPWPQKGQSSESSNYGFDGWMRDCKMMGIYLS